MTVVKSRHTLDWCSFCVCDRVLCVTCGNNCCNGGYGSNPPGTMGTCDDHCPDCPEAYDHQDMFWVDPTSVEFAKDIRPPVNERIYRDPFADIRNKQ